MRYKPTKDGGRTLEGKTDYGKFRLVWDADNNLIEQMHERFDPPPQPARRVVRKNCVHLGAKVERRVCPTCADGTKIAVYACGEHKLCSFLTDVGVKTCDGCDEYEAEEVKM